MSGGKTIAVLGAGAWGTALAVVAQRAGNRVRLWARDSAQAAKIETMRQNRRYLPGIALPAEIEVGAELEEVLAETDIVLCVVPAQATAEIAERIAAFGENKPATFQPIIVGCAKGIERERANGSQGKPGGGRLCATIFAQALPGLAVAALSGPSFAADAARGLPTAVTIAAAELDVAAALCRDMSAGAFRCYASNDIVGVELGGALKNVLAIAVGAARGMRLGASAEAALVARGFAELSRLARALGGRPETLAGLSGLGDLVLTCSQPQSRNFAYGMALGAGDSLIGLPLAEGVFTARVAAELALQSGVDAPIIAAVAEVLEGGIAPPEAVARLLERPLKIETE